ncbi:MAG: cytoskeleton protein RodZ [Pseudohongiellaceae bacterium]|jgi:cytoskeleton protein RodZ
MSTNENQQGIEIDEVHKAEPNAAESVGNILRAERLRRELTEKEVADQLHITMHYVRAIESNSFEKLPGAVFAKGYIKSYALLLGLEQSQVIGSYDVYVSEQQDAAREKTRIQVRRRKDKNRPWVIGSGIGFVSLFLILWFFSSGGQETADLGSDESALAENYIEPEPMADDETDVTQAAMLAPTLAPTLIPITPIAEPTLGDAVQSQLAQIDIDSSVVTKANDPADRATPSVEQEGQQQAQQGSQILSPPAIAASPELEVGGEPSLTVDGRDLTKPESRGGRILIEAEGSDLLLITFLGASWIEVSDSADNLLYRDLRDSGDVLEIKGAAPFDVLLGDAPFAKMTLNGIDIDVSKNTRIDNSARLTVGL